MLLNNTKIISDYFEKKLNENEKKNEKFEKREKKKKEIIVIK